MYPSLSPSYRLLARAQAGDTPANTPSVSHEHPPRRPHCRVHLALFDPAPGIHTVGRLVLFRIIDQPTSLSDVVVQIEAYRAGLPTAKHYAKLVVLVLPFGTSLDPYVEELVDLSERNICVAVDGSVVLTEMLARARVGPLQQPAVIRATLLTPTTPTAASLPPAPPEPAACTTTARASRELS